MSLTVSVDTYISLTDADTYLSANYATTDALLVAWTALTDANCEAYLRKARQIIDRQPLVGFKKLTTQTLEFPRIIYTEVGPQEVLSTNLTYGANWYVQTDVPSEVKYAQCEIAIQLASGTSKRIELQRQGVKSFSLGKLSESYTGTQNKIVSEEARELLLPYIARAVRCV